MRSVPIDAWKLWKLWHSKLRDEEICIQLGITAGRLKFLVKKYALKRSARPVSLRRMEYDPTHEEIAMGTAAIRATWSEDEYYRRSVGSSRGKVEIKRFTFARETFVFSP